MKKMFIAFFLLTICVCLYGCGKENLLISEKWYDINDGDQYVFNEDGTGMHNSTAITYTYENDIVTIFEGMAATQGKNFTLSETGGITKLIPKEGNTYYVVESKYGEMGAKVREENINILLQTKEFKTASGTVFNYLYFDQDGKGWFATIQTGTCAMNWEMLDNNTVKCYVTIAGMTNSIKLDIDGNNGSPRLLSEQGEVKYIPYR